MIETRTMPGRLKSKSANGNANGHASTNGKLTNGDAQQNGHSSIKSIKAKNGVNGLPSNLVSLQESGIAEQGILSRILNFTLVPLFLMIFSPNISMLLWYASSKHDGSFTKAFQYLSQDGILRGLWRMWSEVEFVSSLSCTVILGYCIFAVILMKCLPGPTVKGPVTPKGNTPIYKDNGFSCYILTMAVFFVLQYSLTTYFNQTATIVYDRFGEFLVSLTVLSHVVCVVLYFKGLYAPSTNDCGSSSNLIFDYYWGTELYPKIFGVDVKVFTNCRFGMTVWPLLVTIHALRSYEIYGFVDSIWVSWFLQMVYFTKFFWWESGYMSTIDIMVDRAGFYICWGCLTFIPGVYASVTMYLVNQPVRLGPLLSAAILLIGLSAVIINYWADYQKQVVRRTGGNCTIWGSKPKLIRTKYTLENGETRSSLLLVSGFWGIARHFHYVPELVLALCWSIPALFDNLAPYVYIITLFCILVHRTFRDDEKCSAKYGKYWNQYCSSVPYKMIPGVF